MTPYSEDCIAAIASASGGGARGIVRISGGDVVAIVAKVFRARGGLRLNTVRRAVALDGSTVLTKLEIELPCRLLLWPNARSYTGEPAAELHTIGSAPLLEGLLQALLSAGARMARPGEFTLRAFFAGRMDLTQAEGVLGVIDARSDRELRAALDQLAGGLGSPLRALREQLLDLLAHLEAGLDFVEEDIEFITRDELVQQLRAAQATVAIVAEKLQSRDETAALPRVALVGPPNVGKSSLFNALVRDGRALVADVAGTTRDYLTARLDLDGAACELIDTAGLDVDASESHVAQAAQKQTHAARERVEIELLCRDANTPFDEERGAARGAQIHVLTKADQGHSSKQVQSGVSTSVRTGEGLAELRQTIRRALVELTAASESGVRATAARCRGALETARAALAEGEALAESRAGEELVAVEVRTALHALGEIVGAVYTDDLLDRVFSRFCIGK